MAQEKITLLIADDHPAIRSGLIAMLKELAENIQVIGEAQDPFEAKSMAHALRPHIVITDYEFTHSSESGIDVIKDLKDTLPTCHCIMVTAHSEPRYMAKAFRAGSKAFLNKHASSREYLKAIEVVHSGMTYFPSELLQELDRLSKLPTPTPAELRLIPYFCFAKAKTAKELAQSFNLLKPSEQELSWRTVETHKRNITQKFQVQGDFSQFCKNYCEDHDIEYKNLKCPN